MIGTVNAAAVVGVNGYRVRVEADYFSAELKKFHIVGLPDGAIRESGRRVRAAICHAGLEWPSGQITVNLSPAGLRKDGTGFDLPIALAILAASDQFDEAAITRMASVLIVGELSLDGSVMPVPGVLPRATLAMALDVPNLMVPDGNADEAGVVPSISVIPVSHLKQAVGWLRGGYLREYQPPEAAVGAVADYPFDFSEVKGQPVAKRAMEIAAAGGHNLLMIGPPGTGKTMLARRLVTILPALSFEEALETTTVYSVAGALPPDGRLMRERPFCAPHFTISQAGIAGGGIGVPKPGQISLAHNGVLFLDELPEFSRAVLEVMRGPLEDKQVTLTRSMTTVTYPASVMLVAAMNPCPCGFFGSGKKRCECSYRQVQNYRSRLSGPLLDRIDMHTTVASVAYADLVGVATEESSAAIRERVLAARRKQSDRFLDDAIHCNAEMDPRHLRAYCELDTGGHQLLERCIDVLGMSARGYSRILKVARTIADLTGAEMITESHAAEAVAFRQLDLDSERSTIRRVVDRRGGN